MRFPSNNCLSCFRRPEGVGNSNRSGQEADTVTKRDGDKHELLHLASINCTHFEFILAAHLAEMDGICACDWTFNA